MMDKLCQYALKFDVNNRKFSKQVENIVGIREIASLSNFSFSHSVFERIVLQMREKQRLVWEMVHPSHNPDFYRPSEKGCLKTLWEKKKILVTITDFNF